MDWKFEWFDRVDENGDALFGTQATSSTHILNMSSYPFNTIFGSFTGDAPPFLPINENVPLMPGSYLKFVDTQENEVDLMLMICGTSREDLYNIIHGSQTNGISLPFMFNPTKRRIRITLLDPPNPEDTQRYLTGFGKLRVTTPASNLISPNEPVVRDLICRCMSGFKIRNSDLRTNTAFVPLTFYANQPYWRSAEMITILLGTRDTSPLPAQPAPPKWFGYLDSTTVGGDVNYQKKFFVRNRGDVSTPPKWILHGPFHSPWIHSQTTGQTISFGPTCIVGRRQDMVIDIENRSAYIVNGDEPKDLLNTINIRSEFWELVTERNIIEVRLSNANRYTRASFTYHERFLGAY